MNICEISSKYTVRKLTATDIDAIYALSAGNPLFYEYCPPYATKESILCDMNALPPQCKEEDKYYIGFFRENNLIAVMDLISGYPKEDTAYIGLFMTDKKVQGRGVGTEIIKECSRYLKNQGFRSMQLAYAKENPQSEAFWKKNGFCKTGKETDQGAYISVSMEKII